jgi:hypothetical protein
MPVKKAAAGKTYVAYCVKCKKQVTMVNPTMKKTKNGKHMMQGGCDQCNTTVNKFVSEKEANEQ